ncbi:peptidoglycan-binding domain-containing protein [Frateuria defendens]|uniref:peptidoglycan-binding domain-containing protein n=1 Tax=Frateuria defendens TaxID=2219559 RepID=UPI0007DC19C5|nr:peptidoglycan-binding domain-containing protein [Frateuria defendens]
MTDQLEQARREAEQWHLGQTSASYESGLAGAGAISTGKGDHGGVSYGSYQFSSVTGTLKEYLDQSPYGPQFHGLTPVTPAFDAKWQELARTDPGFGQDQHDFVGRSHYSAQARALQARGLDLSGRGMAVQDALWSTAVQCRDLTPSIFSKGLAEKFGDHYDLAALSDKDIVDAVQDYKIAHVKTLFSHSPKLHDSLKDRFSDEKVALERLADSDAVLRANGVTVEHRGTAPAVAIAHHPSHARHDGTHPGTFRFNDHSERVRDLQARLAALGYAGAGGRPLQADGHFGASTQAAVEAFQRDHQLHVDGVAGARTLDALHRAQQAPAASLDSPAHAGHGMYAQALRMVHELDAQQGRTPDQLSVNFAGTLAAHSRAEGMTRIDHLLLSEDASRAFAVQGDLNSPFKQYASVDIAKAVVQPLDQSSRAWTLAHQQQPQVAASAMEAPQQAPTAPTMMR